MRKTFFGIIVALITVGLIQTAGAKTITEQLANKTDTQKADIKAAEIAKVPPSTFLKNGTTVEVQSITPISGGVEVFAKAWKGGKRVGFSDGTVEIERFRIYNPPVMVPDGTKHTVVNDIGRPVEVDNFKEDPEEALKQVLSHIIAEVGKDDTKIETGKVGHTTSTFFTSGGGDGNSIKIDNASWTTTHDATAGSAADDTSASATAAATGFEGGSVRLYRSAFRFDTSAIASTDTIQSATFSVYVNSVSDQDNDGDDWISVVQLTNAMASDTAVGTADYDQIGSAIANPTEGIDTSERKDLTSVSTSAYLDFALNSTGRSWVARSGETLPTGSAASGITRLGLREGHDIIDSPFSPLSGTNYNLLGINFAETAGTSQDPMLVVVHGVFFYRDDNVIIFE